MPKQRAKKPTITRKQKIAASNEKIQAPVSFVSGPGMDVEYLDAPVKSDCDYNLYRALKLGNDLKVLLVSASNVGKQKNRSSGEPTFKRDDVQSNPIHSRQLVVGVVACRVSVDAGFLSDPPEAPGVAEILCNILPKASRKYPGANRLVNLIKKSGNLMAATTDNGERTEFFFEVSEVHFPEAIDRFVECFVGPLLTISDVANERRCIELQRMELHSVKEIARAYSKQDMLESIASKIVDHPGNNCGLGYMEHLKSQSDEKYLEEVKKFMKRYYSANRIAVVLEGRLPLNTMEHYARTYLSKIPNNGLSRSDYTRFNFDRCFDHPEFRMIHRIQHPPRLTVEGTLERVDLELNWPIPSIEKTYRCKPQRYLAWLMNNESKGSLSTYLKEKGWCETFLCKIGTDFLESNSVYSLFTVEMTLTDVGLKNRKQIIDAIFSYVNLIRREGVQKRLHDEIRKIAEARFRFVPEAALAESYAVVHGTMHFAPSSEYLTAPCYFFEYDEPLIRRTIDLMSPEKANIIVHDQRFYAVYDGDAADFGPKADDYTPHQITAVPKDWIDNWKTSKPMPEMRLPELNPYVSDDYEIVAAPKNSPDYPIMIYSDDFVRVWYKLATKLSTFENSVAYSFCSPVAGKSPEITFMMDLFSSLMTAIQEFESAKQIGFTFTIEPRNSVLLLVVTGRSKKMLSFARDIVRSAKNVAEIVTEDVFRTHRAKLLRLYRKRTRMPYLLASELLDSIRMPFKWTSADKYAAAKKVDCAKFRDFARCFTDEIRIDCLAYGNMTEADVIENARECTAILRCKVLPPNSLPRAVMNEIPRGTHYCRLRIPPPTVNKSVVMNYYQFADNSLKNSVMMKLIQAFVMSQFSTPHEFRNSELLALAVSSYETYGYALWMTKSNESVNAGVSAIERNLETYRKTAEQIIRDFKPRHWKSLIVAIVADIKEQSKSFAEEWDMYLHELVSQCFVFDRDDRELRVLNEITIEELREGILRDLSAGSEMRKLSIQVIGSSEGTGQGSQPSRLDDDSGAPKLDLPKEDEKTSNFLIKDVNSFKRGLSTLPLLSATTVDDIAKEISKDCNVR